MFSVGTERELAKVLFHLSKSHGYQPSEIKDMTYVELKVLIMLLEQHIQEEENYYRQQRGR